MVFASYRQATAATRGSGLAGPIAAAAILALGAAGVVAWLIFAGPVPPPVVTVAPPAAPPAPPVPEAPREAPAAAEPAVGDLPAVGPDGKVAWKEFARPFDRADTRPRIAIVIDALAGSATATENAITHLPGSVTLAFMPYWKPVGQWAAHARESGHEILLDLPMEPPDPGHVDLGPNGLRSALDQAANIQRLEWMMRQASGYVGLIGYQGGRFVDDRDELQPILDDIRTRGLLYVDNRASAQSVAAAVAAETGLPFAAASRQLDADPTRAAIERRLAELEEIARRDGSALGLGGAEPSVVDQVAAWAQTLETRGLVLAPVSAVVAVAAPKPPAMPEVAKKPAPDAPQR